VVRAATAGRALPGRPVLVAAANTAARNAMEETGKPDNTCMTEPPSVH
jgi:hypothetical protein